MSFEHLKRKYNLPNQTFYCYLQLRSSLRAALGPEMTLPVMNDVERFLYDGKMHRLINYNILHQFYLTPEKLHSFKSFKVRKLNFKN